MKIVFVRDARPTDVTQFAEWATKTPNNEIDPAVLAYRSSNCLCAYTKDHVVLYMPVQRPLHMESLAVSPDAAEHEVAAALRALLQHLVGVAQEEGRGEIYFMGTEKTVPKLAERHGFEKLPFSVYRLKLKDLEPCQQ
jgi:hypothetical protein